MMKLTVTLLAALAFADAAEARNLRHARRHYSAAAAQTPSAESGYQAKPYSAAPEASQAGGYKAVPENAVSSGYAANPPAGGAATPAASSLYSSTFAALPISSGYAAQKPDGDASKKPTYSAQPQEPVLSLPAGAKPTGGYAAKPESSKPVDASVKPSAGVYPTGGYAAGTGYKASTPAGEEASKTPYSAQKPAESTPCEEEQSAKVTEIPVTLTETLVYTVGAGSSARAYTTEVTSVSTKTIYKTVIVKPTPAPSSGSGYPTGNDVQGESEEDVTTTSTTTSTEYITVHASKTPAGGEGYPTGAANANGAPVAGDQCAAPVTVTVTAQETVTVTAPAANNPAYTPTGDNQVPSGDQPQGGYSASQPAYPTGKYPLSNGTASYPVAGATGFKTSSKAAYPTGVYSAATPDASSLPVFSFVSEMPYSANTPSSQVPDGAQSTPAAGQYSANYPVGGASTPAAAESTPAGGYNAYPASKPAQPEGNGSYPAATPAPESNGYGYSANPESY